MADEAEATKPCLPYYPDTRAVSYALVPQPRTPLEQLIRSCRLEVLGTLTRAEAVLDTGRAHTNGNMTSRFMRSQNAQYTIYLGAYQQLLDEDNLPARAAIICSLGGLGLVAGSRRGRARGLRRFVLTSLGLGAGVRFCYPEQSQEAVSTLRRGELPSVAVTLPDLSAESLVDTEAVARYCGLVVAQASDLFRLVTETFQSLAQQSSSVAPAETVKKNVVKVI